MKTILSLTATLVLLIACDHYGNYASLLNPTVAEFIQNEYPGASIRSVEYDDNGLCEVEIKHESIVKDVYFDVEHRWVYTTWDVRNIKLPSAVKDAVAAKYPGFWIDDADFIVRADKSYYKIDLERGEMEHTVYVSQNGEPVN